MGAHSFFFPSLLFQNGTRIACGVLKASDPRKANKALKAPLGAYPGYTGPLKPAGMATVYFLDGGAFRFYINLRGVEQNCLECGVHIHTGTTCSDAALVGGHYWNKAILGANTTDDPWTADYGAFYTSNYYGKATRYFYLDQGYGYEDTVGHAVVIHAKDGTRISCGVLNPKWW
jgi:Cu/Zn superoxide dismutase